MKSRNFMLGIVASILAMPALTGCINDPAAQPTSSPAASNDRTTSRPPCPVTLANGNQPPGETGVAARYYGNGVLWTVLPDGGKMTLTPDKSDKLGMKFPWWRGVEGKLTIEGHRLDGPGDKLTADIPDGYGTTGFQATGIYFPGEGCWEVVGKAGREELKFVVEVRKGAE
ncbi:MAG TPA: hypothetical protein VGE04_05545 [Chloroflexia bacterium]